MGSGPTILIPHWENGQGLKIEIRSYTGDFRTESKSLAAITLSSIIGGIDSHGWPIVPLSMGLVG